MRRALSVSLLLVSVTIPQACQRDAATAPHLLGPNASVVASTSKIAFTSGRDGGFTQIYVMAADGSAPTRLTNINNNAWQPSWSPDGQRIAFSAGGQVIYVMNPDGSGQTRLTADPAADVAPSWSPDGRQIAFASARDGNLEIYVMNADGSAPTRLTNNPATDTDPTWSPDGKRIAFASTRDGNAEVYVMNADGSAPTRLTNNAASDGQPSWSLPYPGNPPAHVTFTTQPPTAVWANAV